MTWNVRSQDCQFFSDTPTRFRELTVACSKGYAPGREMTSEIGGDSSSIVIDATSSDPFGEVLTVTGRSSVS